MDIGIIDALKLSIESVKTWTTKNINKIIPKCTHITLLATNWIVDASLCYQDVNLSYVTATSMVNLQPDQEQLVEWQDDGLAFTTYSYNGKVRIYAVGGKPTKDYVIQAVIQEVIEV